MITFIALTAQEFAQQGDDWVKAIAGFLNSVIGQVGILGLAAIGVWKSLSGKAELKNQIEDTKQELSRRLDKQGDRINDVALASAPTTNGKTVLDHPEKVEIET